MIFLASKKKYLVQNHWHGNMKMRLRLVFLESGIKHYSQEIVTGIYFGLNIGLEKERNLIINKLKEKT